ncbi:MAG: hypothetical protein PUG55_05690 [Bacillales bacterium]|nr:hypothetical protein [Bacillales bacterium]
MEKIILDKQNGLYKAGLIVNKVFYPINIVVIAICCISMFIYPTIWEKLQLELSLEPLPEFVPYIFIATGVLLLLFLIAIIIVGCISLKKIENAKTKSELIPWAIVSIFFLSDIGGVLLLCSKQKVVEEIDSQL